jgi:transposase
MKSDEMKLEFEKLRKTGMTYSEIAKRINVSEPTCRRWGKLLEAYEQQRTKLKAEERAPMYNGHGTNQMERINTVGKALSVGESGAVTVTKGCAETIMENFDLRLSGFRVSTLKLWDMLKLKYTEVNRYGEECSCFLVSVTLDEYMFLMGMPDTSASRVRARQTAEEDLETLFSIRLDWLENGKERGRFSTRLCTAKGINNSVIVFSFAPQMASYLSNAYVMRFPVRLLRVDERDSVSYYLGKKLSLHYSISHNVESGTNDIISVACLLEYCEDVIPSYETVMSSNRHTKSRIVEPFIRGMGVLKSMGIISWRFCKEKKLPVQGHESGIGYQELIGLYIEFQIL